MKLGRFDLEGLKANCLAESCEGVIVIERDWGTFHLNPDRIWCILCGQRYTLDTEGLTGWPLEEKLRREGSNYEDATCRIQKRVKETTKGA